MATKIRLTRLGDKKSPFYRIIVADSRAPRDGKFIDILGTYNPLVNPAEIKINEEKAKYWLSKGAQLTDTVRDIFTNNGIIPKPSNPRPAKTKFGDGKKKD
jgi:small subunit ribosomal protein S16